jgi:hypothetical protein
MYNFVYAMFFMMATIYGIYIVEFIQWFLFAKKTEGTDKGYTLLLELAQKNGKYLRYIDNNNMFITYIIKAFIVIFVMNLFFINLLILFRGGKDEKDKKKVKIDFIILICFVLSTSVMTFIFI